MIHRRSATLLSILLITISAAFGQQGIIPTMGKEFWVGFMQNYQNDPNARLDLFISGYVNTSGTVVQPLTGYSQSFTVVANTVTTVSLPITEENTGSGIISDKSFLVRTDDTVAVFALNYKPYTADAAAIFPTQSLGTQYRAHCYSGLSTYKSEVLVVATKDDTEIIITPSVATESGQAAGVPFTLSLDSAQTYQLKAFSALDDLTGTTFVGTEASGPCRPFAVFSGSQCTNIPVGCTACDHIYEQNLPTTGWGYSYYTVPWEGPDDYTYRVLAHTDGTTYTVNGVVQPVLNAGAYMEVNNEAGPVVIESNSPISVAQYMQGESCSGGYGDPALLILNAKDQRINNASFATVVSPNIDDQYIGIVVATTSTANVMLDGALLPAAAFTPYAADPTQSYANFPLNQGSHSVSCPTGLTGYAYGVGVNYETYAYSVGSFSPLPPLIVDSILCGLDSTGMLTLSPPEAFNNPWWTIQSAPEDTLYYGLTYTFAPPASAVYAVNGFDYLSSCQQEYLFSVELSDPPILNATAGQAQVCSNEEVQLDVEVSPPGNYLFNWWPDGQLSDGSLQSPVATPSQSGWFFVSVSTLNGCAVAVDSVFISVVPGNVLTYNATVSDPTICTGDTVELNVEVTRIIARDDFDGAWDPAVWDQVAGGASSTICSAIAGDALNFNGPLPLRAATTVDLNVTQGGIIRTNLKYSTDVAPCDNVEPNEPVVLQYSINGGGAYTTFHTFPVAQFSTWGMVDVAIPAAAQTAATRFRWTQPSFTGAGEDNWQLDDIAIAVNDATDLTFSWTPVGSLDNASVQNTDAWPTSDVLYVVNSVDVATSCDHTDSIFVQVGQGFQLTMTPDTAICDVTGIALSAVPNNGTGHTYVWAPNTDISSIFSATPIVTPSATTTYTVTATTPQGCSATGEVEIIVAGAFDLTTTTSQAVVCQGESVDLGASVPNGSAFTFQWQPANLMNDATLAAPEATPLQDTWFTVLATETNSGCLLSDSVFVDVIPTSPIFAGNDTIVCSAEGMTLSVQHGFTSPTIQWQPAALLTNANTATPTINTNATNTFTVSVYEGVQCASRDTITVTVLFEGLVLVTDSSLCAGETMVIDPGFPDAGHSWSTGETTQTIEVSEAGTYVCTISAVDFTCFAEHTTNITVDALPTFDFGPDTSLCVGQSWTLTTGQTGLNHLWTDGSTLMTRTFNTDGTYAVSVTDQEGCVFTDSIALTFDPLPVVMLNDTIVCVSNMVTLDAGNAGSAFAWSPTGETSQSITVEAASGLYTVVVTTPTICVDSASAYLEFIPFPIVDLGPDTALCDTEQITLDARNDTCSFLWSNGSQAQTVTLFQSALMQVAVDNGYCVTTDSISVVFNPLPNELSVEVVDVCLDYPPKGVVISGENPDNQYLWSPTSETTQEITATKYGWYTVYLTTPLNCSISDSILIREYCPNALYVPNSFTPDGDGFNDYFLPVGTNLVNTELMIFDRWGSVVYQGRDDLAKWDGTIGGAPCKTDVYVWKLVYQFHEDADRVKVGPVYEQRGHVTVLR